MISKDHQFDRRILWAIIAFEALLFYNFYARDIALYPPQNFDQAVYLTEAYRIQERIYAHGLGELWRALWSKDHYGTLAFPIEGALAGLVLAGARLPQLCVVFIAFCALQVVAFTTAQAFWRHRIYGYLILGLILSQSTLWFWAGGLFDFRMDFFAYCLYGIWACTVIRSKLFLDRRWAIGSGLIGMFLVLNRFLTVIYLVGVSAGLAGVCIIIWILHRSDPDLSRRMRQRLFNLGLFLGILVIFVGPIFVINREAIYNKYVYAQFFYEKDIRAREFGIVGLSGHLLYYPISILRDHLGPIFLLASALGLVGALAARLLGRTQTLRAAQVIRGDETSLLQMIFLTGAILGPIVVLTIDISKSPVIGGIVCVPAALLVTSLVSLAANSHQTQLLSARNFIVGTSLVVFALGLFNQFNRATKDPPEYAHRHDLELAQELSKWLVSYASENGWRNPTISLDVISGMLNSGAIVTSGYEQLRQFLEFHTMLGQQVMGVERAEALSLLARSDFVILTTLPKTGVYPFYERVSQYWGDLKAWADQNMILLRTVPFDDFTATVYVRPFAKVSGVSGGWITSAGLSIETERVALQRFPKIRLSGAANYSWLPKVPTVSAMMEMAGQTQAVPASLQRNDNSYEILIDFSKMELPPSDQVRLRLKFDTFFVPSKIGINGDTRELVVYSPTLVQLIPR